MSIGPNKLEKLDICVDDDEGVVCVTVKLKPCLRSEKRVKYTSAQVKGWLQKRGIVTLGTITGGTITNKNVDDREKTFIFEVKRKATEQTTTAILEREEKKKTKKKKN